MPAPTEARKLARAYITERRTTGQIRASTGRNWWYTLSRFADCLPADPARVDKRHILKWVKGHDVARSTLRKDVSIVRGFLDWLVVNKVLNVNPVRRMGLTVKVEPGRIPRALSAEDAAALIAALPDVRAICAVRLGLQLGLRRAEICRLELHDIDWQRRQIRVTGKGDKERIVPMTTEAETAIRDYLAVHPAADGPLIRSYADNRSALSPVTLSQHMRRWFTDAGLKRHPHDGRSAHALRHTCASDVLENCGDITIVRDLLGHADVQTTQIYTRASSPERMRTAMEGRNYSAA